MSDDQSDWTLMRACDGVEGAGGVRGWDLVAADLAYTEELARTALGILGASDPEPALVLRALWGSALTAYARSFVSAAGLPRLEESHIRQANAGGDVDGALTVHRHMVALRNKYVAHSDSALSDVTVGVVADPSGGLQVGAVQVALQYTAEDFDNVGRMAHLLGPIARAKSERALRRLTTNLEAMTPDQLAALPPMRYAVTADPTVPRTWT